MPAPSAPTRLHQLAASILSPVVQALNAAHVEPNVLTGLSVGFAMLAAWAIATHAWWLAILALLSNGLCDMLDGELARRQPHRAAWLVQLGAFLDPAVDRIADSILFLGIIAYLVPWAPERFILIVVGACAANLISSWFRAKIESLNRTFTDRRPLTRATFHVQVLAACLGERYIPGAFMWVMAFTCASTYWTFASRFRHAIALFHKHTPPFP